MSWWQYLLLVNVYLVLFYGFYALLLRKETFFQLNRVYLVSAAALSFFIPVIQSGWVQNLFITQEIKYTVYGNPVMIMQPAPVKETPINIGQILAVIYIAGVAVLFGRLIWQLIILKRIIKKDQHDTAYSFFNKIKLPDEVKDNNIVALHEQVHARQWHSVDVFIIEAVMILNWFNPVVYFYRRAIKHIHEFIADDHATKEAANKAEYAMLLLTQTFHVPSHNLVNSFFNHSLLKQRIIMLQKDKSQRIKLVKYGLSAPLFMLMLILTSATVNHSKAAKAINNKITQVLLLPAPTVNSITKLSDQSAMSEPTNMSSVSQNKVLTVDNSFAKMIADTTHRYESKIFVTVEKEPEFIGGKEKFEQYIADNIIYPRDMVANNISGKVVLTFIVEPDGSVSNVKALTGPTISADDEAVKVIKSTSGKWMPGYQNHAYVRVQYSVPIAFNLDSKVIGYKSQADTGKRPTAISLTSAEKINAIYFVDGKEVSNADAQVFLKDAGNIMSVNVKKDPSDKSKGIIEITTTDNKNVVYLIDGKQISATEARNYYNNKNYTVGFGSDASHPEEKVVVISTKKPVDIVLTPPVKANDPLYIIDGKEVKTGEYIKPEDIESISVLKGKNAELYGAKGANGVIVIVTKAAAKPAPPASNK